jgi:hypothetical protein
MYDSSAKNRGIYFGSAKKANSVREEATIEHTAEMYISSPIPQPARDIVRMRLWWEQALDIDNAEFAAYNLLGSLITRKQDFAINKQNPYSGELVWHPAKLPAGIYFVRCRIGNANCSAPVLIE